MTTLVATQYFDFEADFVEDNIRCIPMIVRFKLDACGIKLKLSEWSKLDSYEREVLANMTGDKGDEVVRYRSYLQGLILSRTGQPATLLPPTNKPGWSVLSDIPHSIKERINELNKSITLRQWQRLTILQRFALFKLSSGGHEHKNFLKALVEFNLA